MTPPSYRFIAIEEDDEGVARVHGFERIPAEPRAAARMHGQPEVARSLHALRAALASSGYQEVINFSFVGSRAGKPIWRVCADPIRLLNPIASQLSVMRTSLLAGLVANVRYNLNRKATRARVFEIGRVFLRQAGAQESPLDVAGIR